MKRSIFKVIMTAVSISLLLASCGKTSYRYNNLTSDEDMQEFFEIMVSAKVPNSDVEAILEYIENYRNGEYSKKLPNNGWRQTTKNYQDLYDYTDAINDYTMQDFEDVNCRQAAFIIYHSFFQASETEKLNLQQESQELPEYLKEEFYKYEILFSRIPMGETVADTVLNFWQNSGVVFEDASVHLISMWGAEDGEVINYHTGIMLTAEDGVLFFEKNDPLLPFQLSRFASVDEIKAHLLSRTGVKESTTIFLDDTVI